MEKTREIYQKPLFELISQAHEVHRRYHEIGEVQRCHLISFKTGGCPEDCSYCAQAARYQTEVAAQPLLQKEELLTQALRSGATRVCIGAAWRGVRNGKAFDTILEVVETLTQHGIEVCCTLGTLTQEQAQRLHTAGLYAYNHNLDTSKEYYSKIISTRPYEERLETLQRAHQAGISLCCGGILGMGESEEDRISLLHTLAELEVESVPLNFLSPIKGTPLEKCPPVPIWEMVRMIATARILMPNAMVRLSAGRQKRSLEEQALCFFAGANSIFIGEKLLTIPNTRVCDDEAMFKLFGFKARPPFKNGRKTDSSFSQVVSD